MPSYYRTYEEMLRDSKNNNIIASTLYVSDKRKGKGRVQRNTEDAESELEAKADQVFRTARRKKNIEKDLKMSLFDIEDNNDVEE